MKNGKNQTVEKDDEKVTSTRERMQETSAVTNRTDINVLTARNEKEVAQDRKASYKKAGIVVLLVVVIIIAVYFLSK